MLKLFDLSLKLNGFPIKEAKAQLQQIIDLSEEEFKVFLEQQKKEIAQYHLDNSPFYRELAKIKTFENWEDLPILQKSNLQKPLKQRLSKGYTLDNIYRNKTSGSSGIPFIFAKDKYCHAMTWASIMYRFGWWGIDFNSSYQARFYGILLDDIKYYKERFKDFLSRRYRFAVYDLSEAKLEQFLQKFKSTKFDYINGYTSTLVLFAKYLQQKNIVLKSSCPSLRICIVTSEMLFEADRQLMEKQFGIPVINEYGASELDLIAFENPQGEWQLNSETLYVEILDQHNRSVPNGEPGRIVLSSLFNKAHPFIRYDIGDIGVLDEKSTLKKPILKKLIGRTNDIALLPSGKKAPGLTVYYITKSIMDDQASIREFVIKQTKIDTFEIDYVSDKELDPTKIKEIEQAIYSYLEPQLQLHFSRKTILERSPSGKLKQFTSLIS